MIKTDIRPHVRGKFIFVGKDKFYIRGVTYGPFHPDSTGNEYHTPKRVEQDFSRIAASGMNAIRTYTPPPEWLLDIAYQYNLRVMVGLPWEQHIAFLDDKKRLGDIEKRISTEVAACAGHPGLLCYTIGNEIPAPVVRWYGRHRVARFLERLYRVVKTEDPDGLVTYVNYPTTEYLELPFIDFVCFNVYLESQQDFEAYLARLQNLAENRPLVMAEIGLDSRSHSEDAQASALDWQIQTAYAAGCAGTFVFAWTDEWHRGGIDIEDWDFGLTDRNQCPKAALETVRKVYTTKVPVSQNLSLPCVSVVVCSYNGASTLRNCLEGLLELEYPNFEVIVVDDGSTDATSEIASEYGFRVIRTENNGLSVARNIGMEAANGEIVAYIDDDAYPDPHWLIYLSTAFLNKDVAGVGGPNIAPPDDGFIADGVSNAPGGPIHVLLSDWEAEHIPGCNMAIRKSYLQEIGGFDSEFRAAGDDVDVCWRLRERGWKLLFSPGAMVWHHPRKSIRAYWKQQRGYGKAEALLEIKWPQKYNSAGHIRWSGHLYGKGITRPISWLRERIYQGTWGSAPFQSLYKPDSGKFSSLPLMPEWYIAITLLMGFSMFGAYWKPLLYMSIPFVLSTGISVFQAIFNSTPVSSVNLSRSGFYRLKLRCLTAFLHLLQPAARLYGRLQNGLTPWGQRGRFAFTFPRRRLMTIWSESWQSAEEWLTSIETSIRNQNGIIMRGNAYSRWDLEVHCGLFGSARMHMVIEEHGSGRQLTRFRIWPRVNMLLLVLGCLFATLSILATIDQAWVASVILGLVSLGTIIYTCRNCGSALAAFLYALRQIEQQRVDRYSAKITNALPITSDD